MFTIIAFLLTMLGSINWLLIGLLQYDFVAGIFGYQASVFSRIIYIVIGAASVFLVFKMIKNKGVLPIFSWRNKKDLAKNIEKMKHHKNEKFLAAENNIESSAEFDQPSQQVTNEQPKGLFDEHFEDRESKWENIFP